MDTMDAEVLHAIIDPAEIENAASGRKDRDLRTYAGAGEAREIPVWIEQHRKAIAVLPGVPCRRFSRQFGIDRNGKEERGASGVRIVYTIHFRRIAIADRAVRHREIDDDRSVVAPFRA